MREVMTELRVRTVTRDGRGTAAVSDGRLVSTAKPKDRVRLGAVEGIRRL
jgi:hypothetical protein